LQILTDVPDAEVVERGTKKTGWRKCSTNVMDGWTRSCALREIVWRRILFDDIKVRAVDVLCDAVLCVIIRTEVVLDRVYCLLDGLEIYARW
jgi:hypothetical protein